MFSAICMQQKKATPNKIDMPQMYIDFAIATNQQSCVRNAFYAPKEGENQDFMQSLWNLNYFPKETADAMLWHLDKIPDYRPMEYIFKQYFEDNGYQSIVIGGNVVYALPTTTIVDTQEFLHENGRSAYTLLALLNYIDKKYGDTMSYANICRYDTALKELQYLGLHFEAVPVSKAVAKDIIKVIQDKNYEPLGLTPSELLMCTHPVILASIMALRNPDAFTGIFKRAHETFEKYPDAGDNIRLKFISECLSYYSPYAISGLLKMNAQLIDFSSLL